MKIGEGVERFIFERVGGGGGIDVTVSEKTVKR